MPQALGIQQVEGKPGKVYYPLRPYDVPKPTPGPKELLVRISAASLNHRDLFIRRHLYPGISFATPMLADASGTVVEVGDSCADPSLLNQPVVLTPCRGWDSDPAGPEDPRGVIVLGNSRFTPLGMAQEYVVVAEGEVERLPAHLSAVEAAALPLVGLTGWRALVTKSGNAEAGRNILVTGIGGGVALSVLQFAAAMGCNVFVTSGSPEKIERAKAMGARGGVPYKSDTWEKELAAMLPKDRPFLDAIVDGAGGDILARTIRILKHGGVIAQYGMTVAPKMDWPASAFLKNIDLRGTSMGSRKEFADMVDFVREKKITPVVDRVVRGLDNLDGIEGLFKVMDEGKQFGKLVIEINGDSSSRL
ncbi:related to alcohol dehydrogenase [Cephalotrichum gorgonifer]|uniref:Related to alcohol dehydrogenase n=1 Tax=Cephalotrichum gorgonifer TaxID=2041049 RepID=A0AAE8N6S6_9PEZI|nr:related to alcohol dehydrogenase [Cephalotrichum gorgonifer]